MNLKEIRISKGLTQLEASKIVLIPLRTYKRYENDESYQKSFKYEQIIRVLSDYSDKPDKKEASKQLKIAIAGIGYVGLSLGVSMLLFYQVYLNNHLKP